MSNSRARHFKTDLLHQQPKLITIFRFINRIFRGTNHFNIVMLQHAFTNRPGDCWLTERLARLYQAVTRQAAAMLQPGRERKQDRMGDLDLGRRGGTIRSNDR